MKRSLRGVSQGLLALALFVSVIGLCPCPVSDSAMDCCEPGELSMAGMCCAAAASPSFVPAPASVLGASTAPALIPIVANQPAFTGLIQSRVILARPVVARTILRI